MINNMWGRNWWQTQQDAKPAEKEPVPKLCVFCSVPIEEDDIYWLGYDRHRIFAITCNHLYCKRWLEWKVKRKKQ